MMSRLLVTGASGFVGRALVESLGARGGYELHATTWGAPRVPLPRQLTWHECNLLETHSVQYLFERLKPTMLIHLAWCADHATYWKDHSNFDWLYANLNIARSFVLNGGKRALFAGSSAEYDWSSNLPLKETTTPLKPQLLYGSCKAAAFVALQSFFSQEGVSWAWVRLFNPFGPHEDRRRLIPRVCTKLIAGEKISFDNALSSRDFLHIDDVGAALTAIALTEVQGPVNVASGAPARIRDVVAALARIMQKEHLVHFSSSGSLPDTVVADVARLREEVHWTPLRTFEERLQQTCDWWRCQSKGQQ
jgi:nucleoside-diphosphate-sugar epimerase